LRGFDGGFDLNALCMGHITGNAANANITALPDDFNTEAKAAGADCETTASGFETVRPLFTEPDMLYGISPFGESETVKNIVRRIASARAASKNKKILLKLNGPYSVLAPLVRPELFYRWLAKRREAVHHALDSITASLKIYLNEAIDAGAGLVSVADPYANVTVLGEKRYREFAAAYLLRMLRGAGWKKSVIHLCPHSSIPLVRFGYFETADIPVTGASYQDALVRLQGPLLLGNRCIYAGETGFVTRLV
jgi:uroporphyrinogen-III decarboxylase